MIADGLIKEFYQFRKGDETSIIAAGNGLDEKSGGKTGFTYSCRSQPDDIPAFFQHIEGIVEVEHFFFIQFLLLRYLTLFSNSSSFIFIFSTFLNYCRFIAHL